MNIIIITLVQILSLQVHVYNTYINTYAYTSSKCRQQRWTIQLKIISMETKQDRTT